MIDPRLHAFGCIQFSMWFYLPFQVISALIVLYRVATFNDCKDAAKELQQVMLALGKSILLVPQLQTQKKRTSSQKLDFQYYLNFT